MCGIYCSLSKQSHVPPSEELQRRLRARGPDSKDSVSVTFDPELARPSVPSSNARDQTYLTFYSTVLSLRSSQVVTQPCQDEAGQFTFCWNGEAWSIDGERPSGNDTDAVFQLLTNALGECRWNGAGGTRGTGAFVPSAYTLASALSRIAGPYAFVLFDHVRGRLYFGRDFLGRRSLMVQTTGRDSLVISTVFDGEMDGDWAELETTGVHCVDLNLSGNVDNLHGAIDKAQLQAWGKFQVLTAPYPLVGDCNAGSSNSVIPLLSLNKDLSYLSAPHDTKYPYEALHSRSPAVASLETRLRDSLSYRVLNIPSLSSNINDSSGKPPNDKLAILFSGGLDCTVLARLAHDLLPSEEPIDLLNVAFENPRLQRNKRESTKEGNAYELCPDRITGRTSYTELTRVCPSRSWSFVTIDIPYSETQQHRETVISLMHPHNTEMDLSICNALYFAARGKGTIAISGKAAPYTTSARVLLSGLGADELFAGYTRHATAFKRGGFESLLSELELDVIRLGKRNLGRDDRVMSQWAREVRYPYLDEALLSWALNTPVPEKCGFEQPGFEPSVPGDADESATLDPDKKVLRCLAWKLGMKEVAKEKKRAVSAEQVMLPELQDTDLERRYSLELGLQRWKQAKRKARIF